MLQEHHHHCLLCPFPEHGEPQRKRLLQLLPVRPDGDASLHSVLGYVSLVLQTNECFLITLLRRVVSTHHTAHTSTYEITVYTVLSYFVV